MNKLKYLDLLLYSEENIKSMEVLMDKHKSNLQYLKYLPEHLEVSVIQHAGFDQVSVKEGVQYKIRKGKNKKWDPNISLFWHIRKQNPDVILVHSMIYAWQIIFLRMIIGRKCRIIVQNHAEQPFTIKKRWIQKLADRFISAYLFVSKEQAMPWIKKGIIKNPKKIFEVMEGSTNFAMIDNPSSKENKNIADKTLFLWVGRLDKNKDPLTVLKAFSFYLKTNPEARLWMIYHTTELLSEIKEFIQENSISPFVELIGEVEHKRMQEYYNTADYFILGSYYEGSGYALCEAMACGCVPIVTKIPSFANMLDHGACGHLFEPGNSEELYKELISLKKEDFEAEREKVLRKFEKDLSFKAIGEKISGLIFELTKA